MRTTLTIEDDLLEELKEVAHRKRLPLKQLVNRLLRLGLQSFRQPRRGRRPYRCPSIPLGSPLIAGGSLDKALELASRLEDEEVVRKLELRK